MDDEATESKPTRGAPAPSPRRVCGVTSFARGKDRSGNEMIAVNARCLDGVDPQQLAIRHVDGKSR